VADYSRPSCQGGDEARRKAIIASRVKKPYTGFVVLNKNSTVVPCPTRDCFNDRETTLTVVSFTDFSSQTGISARAGSQKLHACAFD
jgi:hypothetical protein